MAGWGYRYAILCKVDGNSSDDAFGVDSVARESHKLPHSDKTLINALHNGTGGSQEEECFRPMTT